MLVLVLGGISYYYALPDPLFDPSYSTVIEDKSGSLLGARIANDQQWRFPVLNDVPHRFSTALVEFEDRGFYQHMGVDVSAVGRALIQNVTAGKVVSGASTISMQVIRIAKKNPKRTVWEKVKEMIQATRLELAYSKNQIIKLYASHAPFGGNVVGLEAASWRYFHRGPDQLSWAETAMLAVLPNSPGLIHPGRNRKALKTKRDRLLYKLYQKGTIDSLSYKLALLEPIPEKPIDLPNKAPHVVARYYKEQRGFKVHTTIDEHVQEQVNTIVDKNYEILQGNGIQNAAVLVLDVRQQSVLAYVGNTKGKSRYHGQHVDVIQSGRSTGSILKPLLYMLKLNEGELTPHALVPDIPSTFSDYSPENFNRTYDGAVPASEALSRSLNVPAVYMLQKYGVSKFHHYLKEFGFSTLRKPPEHYGLSLILGGADATLWDITTTYGSLAMMLNTYDARRGSDTKFQSSAFSVDSNLKRDDLSSFPLSPGAIWSTFEAMVEVNRPGQELSWRRFQRARKVAWKTGTSFGNRDGWAVGVTPGYVVGVWVGNADGEGRPGLTGIKAAAPILFDVFDILPNTEWFSEPLYEMQTVDICSLSGYRAGKDCPKTHKESIPKTTLNYETCPLHKLIHINKKNGRRMNSRCSDVSKLSSVPWFILPPVQEWYYKKKHPEYKLLPDLDEACGEEQVSIMRLIYPLKPSKIFIPKEIDGAQGKAVFEIAHRNSGSTIYWHLNGNYVGETHTFHQMSLSPKPGKHILTAVDENGTQLEHTFEIIAR